MNTVHLARNTGQSPGEYHNSDLNSEDAPQQVQLYEILRIMMRQKKVICGTTAVVMLLVFVILNNLTPQYTASVLVEIDPRHARIVDFDSVISGLSADDESIRTEIAIIQSRKIVNRVVERLNLMRDPEFNPQLRQVGLLNSWRYVLADWLIRDNEAPQENSEGVSAQESEQTAGFFDEMAHALAGYLAPPIGNGDGEDGTVKKERESVIDEVLKNLTVKPEERTRIVRISFQSQNPKTATAVADAIADYYIVEQLESKFEATKRAAEWLNERVLQLREDVMLKERAIEEYRAKAGLLQGGAEATLASEQISDLNAQHMLEVARLAEAQARLRQANKLLSSPEGIESSIEVLESPLIRELRTQEAILERQVADFADEYGEKHPAMISARAELQDLRNKIKLEVNRVIEGLRNEVAVANARASTLADSLQKHKEEIAQLNQSEVELRSLELDANASRTLLENLLERTKQTASQEDFQQADASVLSNAVEPRNPSFPRKSFILSLSLIFGATLGVLLAFFIEHLDFGLRSGEQISRTLKAKSLGLLPRMSKFSTAGKSLHDYILNHPDSAYGEGIRTLFTNLLLTDVAQRPKVIMMASALPNEGKTTVTLSLGRQLAAADYKVVIVDCDLRNPMVCQYLGIEAGPGLLDCLTSGVPIGDVIQEDKASGAHVLRAGTLGLSSPEQLDSISMQKLLRNLSRHYDIVLLDSAPLLAVSDSLFLARLADKTVLLVRWAKTRRAVASTALERLLAAKADVAGVLLTMVDVKSHARYGFGDSGLYHGKFRKYYSG